MLIGYASTQLDTHFLPQVLPLPIGKTRQFKSHTIGHPLSVREYSFQQAQIKAHY